MKLQFFEYSKCSTCVKARRWLESRAISFEAVPIVDKPPTQRDLLRWMRSSDLNAKKFFNTSGVSYREGKFGERIPSMTLEQMSEALAADGKLIKRPLLVDGERVIVGFDEKTYREHFSKS
jgi:arsenate reductase